jgi:predicted dehydrogenase
MKKIRFGMTGSGFMFITHAEALKLMPEEAELVAVWGGSRAPTQAERYGISNEKSLKALVSRPDIDAIVITTPHHCHIEEVVLALEAGKHVLVEKPMATTVEDCDRMIYLAAKKGLTIATGYHQRFRQNNARAQELVASGAIGHLQTVSLSMPIYKAAPKDDAKIGHSWAWWDDPKSLGHILNSLTHGIDMIRWYTGAEVSTVSAFCRTFIPGLKVEDTTYALLEFTNGTIGSFYSSRAMPGPIFKDEDFRFRLMGSEGMIDLNPYAELRLGNKDGWKVVCTQAPISGLGFDLTRMGSYCKQFQGFIDGIRGKPMYAGNGADGRAGVAACLAMLQSSKERRWVDLGR